MDIVSHYSTYTTARSAVSQAGTNTAKGVSDGAFEEMAQEVSAKSADRSEHLYNGSMSRAKLSDAEIAALANKYDVRSMGDSEYDSFLDDLESMGAISADEKRRLGYKGIMFLDLDSMTTCWMAPVSSDGSTPIFNRMEANGDIYRWLTDRIQWKPGGSSDPAQKKAREDEVEMYNALADIVRRMDARRGANDKAEEKAELIRQLADGNSEFYVNMRAQLKAQVEKSKEDKEAQDIIDALGKVLDALSGKEDVTGKKVSLNKSASEMAKTVGNRISELKPTDPERIKLEQMLKRLEEIGIYVDLDDMDDLWQGEDETFETLTQLLARRQAEEISKNVQPNGKEVNETA